MTCQYNILLHVRMMQLHADVFKLPYMVFCWKQPVDCSSGRWDGVKQPKSKIKRLFKVEGAISESFGDVVKIPSQKKPCS